MMRIMEYLSSGVFTAIHKPTNPIKNHKLVIKSDHHR